MLLVVAVNEDKKWPRSMSWAAIFYT